jgi:hypothetical protein
MAAAGTFKVPHGPDGTVWVGMMDKTYQDAVNNAICAKPEQGNGVLSTLRDAIPLPGLGSDKPNAAKPDSTSNTNSSAAAAGGSAKG